MSDQHDSTPAPAATTETGDLAERYRAAMIPVFGTPQRVLARGEGARVWDESGREYLDLLGGIAVNALGHAHPDVVAALTKQIGTLGHVSNFFASRPQIELAEKLLRLAQAPEGSGVFFTNSGTEALETAFKIARRTGRPRVLALENAFHGRTMGALALTHKKAYRAPFEPLPGGVSWIPAGDVEALRTELARGDVAALVAEPIQGEAGVLPVSRDYLRAARDLTRERGTLLILDEVQTGIGRTGRWFAHQDPAGGKDTIVPDVMTVAKGLGGGFPIGAAIAFGSAVRDLLQPGEHGTTFGGNPVGAAVALTVLGTIAEDGLLENARTVGAEITSAVLGSHPAITSVTGEGLLLGIHLDAPIAAEVVTAALEAGFIVNAANPSTIRLAPPLVLTPEEARSFTEALPGLLDTARSAHETTTGEDS